MERIESDGVSKTAIDRLKNFSSKAQVYGEIRAVSTLNQNEIDRMFQLMLLYYSNVTFEKFKKDLSEKNDVILLRDQDDSVIQGFSTLLVLSLNVEGHQALGVYSGDTVLEKSYWGTTALGKAFLSYLWKMKTRNLSRPVYWFLISKGYKTYLQMANNFKTHYPRYEKATPLIMKKMMDHFYSQRFEESYKSSSGLIQTEGPSCKLRETVAPIDEKLLKVPRIEFFHRMNPSWQRGDELTCIAEMTLWMPAAYAIKKLWKGIWK